MNVAASGASARRELLVANCCFYFGFADVPFDSPATVPTATPAAAIRPIFSSSECRCLCLSGAIASPAGRDAAPPTVGTPSAVAAPSGCCICCSTPGCGAGVAGSTSVELSGACGAGFSVLGWFCGIGCSGPFEGSNVVPFCCWSFCEACCACASSGNPHMTDATTSTMKFVSIF